VTRTRRLLGILALFAGVSSPSCVGSSESTISAYLDTVPLPEEPLILEGTPGTHGGRFVIVGNTAPQTFNPVTGTSVYTSDVTGRLYVGLTRFDRERQVEQPALASRWECTGDALQCTFYLRRGARFSDGHPISSDDVLFSFRAFYDEKVANFNREQLMVNGRPLDVSAPDPYSVVVRSPEPNGSLLAVLSTNLNVFPKHVLESSLSAGTFNTAYGVASPPGDIVTSGPWVVKQYVGNERVVLGRNPYWFGTDAGGRRLPYLDELVFEIAPDQDAADLKFRSGEVDAIGQPRAANYQWYEEHQQEGRFRLHDLGSELGPMFMVFNLNPRDEPGRPNPVYSSPSAARWLRNASFRRALSLAIDRDAMIASVMFGAGAKYWTFATPADAAWSIPDIPHDDYNPEEARRLLASLGMKDGDGDGFLEDVDGRQVTFSLKLTANNPTRVGMGNFVRDDLAKVGVKLTLVPIEFNMLTVNVNRDFQFDAIMMGIAVTRPDPFFAAGFWRSSGNHPWQPRSARPGSPGQERVDRLMDSIRASADQAQRKAWWTELHTIANAQAWVIWMPVQTTKVPVRSRFANVRPARGAVSASGVVWNAEEFYVRRDPQQTN
jgi:peptide/nickel transport system substrate-binding protein